MELVLVRAIFLKRTLERQQLKRIVINDVRGNTMNHQKKIT
jgi:hypothetical protein